MSKKILVINGPNLEMLGKRKENIYGDFTLKDLEEEISKEATKLDCIVEFFQNNVEGELINKINDLDDSYNGIIINPGGFTHTSVALHDSLEIKKIPKIEVHISNIYKREEFRHKSLISDVVTGGIFGLGADGYILAIISMQKLLQNEN